MHSQLRTTTSATSCLNSSWHLPPSQFPQASTSCPTDDNGCVRLSPTFPLPRPAIPLNQSQRDLTRAHDCPCYLSSLPKRQVQTHWGDLLCLSQLHSGFPSSPPVSIPHESPMVLPKMPFPAPSFPLYTSPPPRSTAEILFAPMLYWYNHTIKTHTFYTYIRGSRPQRVNDWMLILPPKCLEDTVLFLPSCLSLHVLIINT